MIVVATRRPRGIGPVIQPALNEGKVVYGE
jgi:hypothetical protein